MGVHIISPQIFPLLTETGAFSIVQAYLRLAAERRILAYPAADCRWLDLGKNENLQQAAQLFPEIKA